LLRRVEKAGSSVPSAARRAFEIFAEDAATAQLSFYARWLTHRGFEAHLASHRVIHEDLARRPSIAATPLSRPLFIVGLPRTGTTLLHHLLALDPNSQCLRAYELMRPARPIDSLLPAALVDWFDWARLALLLRVFAVAAPQWPHHHELNAGSPEECLFALQRSMPLDTHYRAKSRLLRMYAEESEIPEGAYSNYRVFLQQVQARRGSVGQHYVLKGQLLHLQYLDALRCTFPEARIVWTHRPPAEVVGSLCSLRRSQQEIFTKGPVNLAEVGQGVLDYLSGALEQAQKALAKPAQTTVEAPVMHVHYEALVKDPIRTVEELYMSWGWEVSPAHRAAMEAYLTRSLDSRAKKGKDRAHYHDAKLERYGLSLEKVSAHFAVQGVEHLASVATTAFHNTSGVVPHSKVSYSKAL